jgi:O-antigen/teichoic acid export membrane protein
VADLPMFGRRLMARFGRSRNAIATSADSVALKAATTRKLRFRALSLGMANTVDYALQFLLPIVLVRYLDSAAIGEYRLLWLAVGTVLPLATMGIPGSLYYYFPRSDASTKRLYINHALLFLSVTGLIAAWAISAWNPGLPETIRLLAAHGAIVPAFVLLWVISALLNPLPSVDERVKWQVGATIGLSALRAIALSAAAILTGDIVPVMMILLAFAVFKVALLLRYVSTYHGLGRPLLCRQAFADQVRFAAPNGAAGALYGLRIQADQWVAAALFSAGMFASFSIAAVLSPLMNLFRLSVNHAFMPSMSRHQASGDIHAMLELNSQANVTVAVLVCPIFAFAFVFAADIVSIVYTSAYVEAAPAMQVYIIGLSALVVELSTVTMLLRLAPFVTGVNVVALLLSAPLSWFFAQHVGLAGAAVGSVAVIYLDRLVIVWRISRLTGIAMGRLQDWWVLARTIIFSMLAGLFAWGLVSRHFAASIPLVRMFAGGVSLLAVYGAMHAMASTKGNIFAKVKLKPSGRGSV